MFTEGGTLRAGLRVTGRCRATSASSLHRDNSAAGSYAVDVSQSASQATDTGSATFASGVPPVGAAESYTVTSDGTRARATGSRPARALPQVASGLDAAFAQAGLESLGAGRRATAGASSFQITSAGLRIPERVLVVASSGSDELGLAGASFVGTDVAGTINGVAATGDGQVLSPRLRPIRRSPASRCS